MRQMLSITNSRALKSFTTTTRLSIFYRRPT